MESLFIGNWNTQLKKGMLIFLVMSILKKKSCYGHEIIQKIKEKTGIIIADGTLYPLLKKLKQENYALSKWEVSDENSPRKYYYLTGIGNSTVNEMTNYWKSLNNSIETLIS